jgi:hypothetical protein
MEHGDIDHALEDLETRIERLRALYEQYFMGIEKLEPLVVRKDLERRMQVLRREQIRNTAQRFKFQMLVQRYNTLQQYWARVTREIDSGTYRRDVMRAAARFGEKQALTILGKKRAEKYAALAEAQKSRSDNRRDGAAAIDEIEEIEAELDEDLDVAHPSTQRSHHVVISDMAPPPRAGDATVSRAPILAISPPPLRAELPERPAGDVASAQPAAVSPARAVTTKQRVAELAAQMKAQREAARAEAAVAAATPSLDLDFTPSSRTPTSKRSSFPPSRRDRRSRSKLSELPPPSTGPISRSPTSRRARSSRSIPPPAPVAIAPPPPLVAPLSPKAPPSRREPSPPAVEQKPGRPRPAPPPPVAALSTQPGDAGLPDARLRQIYAKYVETKRSVKESTAGVTFEKLADSLRTQAAKLRSAHPSKSVDYEVVVKDGKTLLKPIIR